MSTTKESDEERKRRKEKKKKERKEKRKSSEGNEQPSKKLKSVTTTTTPSKTEQQEATRSRPRTRSVDLAEAAAAQTPGEWRAEHSITVRMSSGDEIPDAFCTFDQAPFSDRLQQTLQRAGFTNPTPIQAQAWPVALMPRDLISVAKTGSGKTLGFLLPCFTRYLQQSQSQQQNRRPVLLVLAPTRELSVQIQEAAGQFGRSVGIRSVCCYGGASKYPQIAALSRGVQVVIATPGRLNDLLEMRKVDLSNIQYLVLDEADRMLDMGFEPQIRSILQHVPKQRQTLLFSATWPREIQALASEFLHDPVQINVGDVNSLVANKDITQTVLMCREDEKFDQLKKILTDLIESAKTDAPKNGTAATTRIAGGGKEHAKVICFCAKKISCGDLAQRLWEDGYAVDCLHGDRVQWERTRVMGAFRSGQLRMLIATDVAARGLDVKDVGVVVNYDMPAGQNGVEDYVHRIGRTGRAGQKGEAYTFFTERDKKLATQLVDVLRKAEQEVPPALQAMVRPRFSRGGGGRGYYGRGGRGGRGRGYMGGGGGRGRGYMGGGGGGRGGYGRGGGGGRRQFYGR